MPAKPQYQLVCMANYGEFLIDSRHPDLETAKRHSAKLGSRWAFYPVQLIVSGTCNILKARLLVLPRDMEAGWQGRTVGTLQKFFAANADAVCNWINGKSPFPENHP